MNKPKPFILSVLTILIGAVVAILLGELLLRGYQYVNPIFVFPDRSYNRFRGQPHANDYSFQLNSKGFKDVEFERTKQQGRLRILGIGDSFVFGVVPYPYNFLTLLEDRLQGEGLPVEVINMGIPGTSPREYLAIFLHEGFDLNPDIVLLCLFVGNDFEETKGPPVFQSYVVSLIRYLITARQHWKGNVIHDANEYHDDQETMSENRFLEIETARSHIFRRHDLAFERSFTNTVAYLKQIRDLCRQQQSHLLVVVMPDEMQVNLNLQKKVREQVKVSAPEEWDFSLPNRMLAAELQTLGIWHIDLLDSFKTMSQQMPLYKPQDSHWNIAGNKIAADVLAKKVLSILNDASNPNRTSTGGAGKATEF